MKYTPLIFEQSKAGRRGCDSPILDMPKTPIEQFIPSKYLRTQAPELPEVDELTLVRHYTNLSKKNLGVDDSFYPLGSCTMKYNPKINETLSGLSGFTKIHPYQDELTAQGVLELLYELAEYLKEISGLAEVTLQPAAGAQGEFTGLKIIRAYFQDHPALSSERAGRKYVLIPDSAHGTNPASVTFCGYKPVEIKSDSRGNVDLEALKARLNPETAALMLTIPNTLGLFDEHLKEIVQLVHQNGSFLYMDGANLNALLGIMKPGAAGVDVLHYNLHKTFSTPHGGGGPGSGPIAVCKKLVPYLPVPLIKSVLRSSTLRPSSPWLRRATEDGTTKDEKVKQQFVLDYNQPKSIGRIKSFYGHINVALKAYVYIRMLGAAGLKKVSECAVLNANYIARQLKEYYRLPYNRTCLHECVLTGERQLKGFGVKTMDIAKRLLDYGFHPPTIYFPLIIHEALMIEPTETESKETLDEFIEAMIKIAQECESSPDLVKSAPQTRPVRRLDEVRAARELRLKWSK